MPAFQMGPAPLLWLMPIGDGPDLFQQSFWESFGSRGDWQMDRLGMDTPAQVRLEKDPMIDSTATDRTAAVDRVFAQMADESDDFGDF
jgi:hypothetical protein